MAGLILDPWQQYVLKAALGERQDGMWAAFEVAIIVSWQNGKNGIVEARELAALYLLGEMLTLHSSHEFKTTAEGFRRLLFLIENCADLERRVKKVTRAHGDEGIELKTGQRIRFVARTSGSGRGFSGDLIVLDEAMILSTEAMGALLPTLSARPNPQVWYTSSAGRAESTQLARVVKRGRAGNDPSLAYFEWSIDDGDPHDDPASWAKANPALGIRISEEHIRRELAAMDFTEFARERLGVGTYAVEGEDEWTVISEASWSAASDLYSEPTDPVTFAVDVPPDRASATIAVAGGRTDGRRHTEIVDHAAGTSWVADRLKTLVERWSPKAVALDVGGPAGSLMTELEQAGIKPLLVGSREMAQACGAFYSAVLEDRLRHRGGVELTAALGRSSSGLSRLLGEIQRIT
jgi:hypothetical protein